MAESEWRLRSRQVIDAVLGGMSAMATLKEKRQALRASYPFGQRRYHPYKMWLKEVREALAPEVRREAYHSPQIHLCPEGVICGWCKNNDCLACLAARSEFEAVVELPEWSDFWEVIDGGNATARLALADWLEERGFVALLKILRKEP